MEAGSVAIRALHLEIKSIRKDPIEGVVVDVDDESNLFEWNIGVFGPPKTLYEGGYFKAKMTFPQDYPYSPPSFKFSTKMWHPNIYETGDVCISILHPPTNDPRSGELPQERWNPTQNVRTILLSVISLLNEPNTSSPANVDASVMFKKYQLSGDKEYQTIISKQVLNSRLEAEKEGIHIPSSIEEYCIKHKPHSQSDSNIDICDDWYDDDDDYLEQDDEEECFDNDDSGNEDQ
ncbi:ubiquitin-conjugating enzyme E2 R2 isoform X1 [Hydra vulgaris]|uniref:Ubiquitin-conjugating enzyme E2 R2 n=1 Tax=Hydra vulgaris TaxID=6087 RepID=T2MBC6_HYDVU|nr:ubiquitin-conjugating enzyme E2 R2-like [Hydra vulgaris]